MVGLRTPTTSPRATTRRHGGRAGRVRPAVRSRATPGRHAVELRQIDGMPREPQRARSRAARALERHHPPGHRSHG